MLVCLTLADIRLRPGSGGAVPETTTGGVRSSAGGTASEAAMTVARCRTQPSILSTTRARARTARNGRYFLLFSTVYPRDKLGIFLRRVG